MRHRQRPQGSPLAELASACSHHSGLDNPLGVRGRGNQVIGTRKVRYASSWREQAFRYNEREGEDTDRFAKTLGSVAGRRLTYGELTGKTVSD